MMKYEDRTIADDMVFGCTDVVDRDTAVSGIRAICRHFGGQLIYMPLTKTTGETTKELLLVLYDEVGDLAANRMMDKLMALFGGYQLYIPMERNAFRDVIAKEIYERYNGDNQKIRDLCREYGISFTQVYRLWAEGRDNKKQMALNFEEE